MSNVHHLSHAETTKLLTQTGQGAGMAIIMGNVLDTIPGCLVIGANFRGLGSLSLTLMLGMFLGGIPEAAASAAILTRAGFKAKRIFGLWSTVLVAGVVAAAFGKTFISSPESLVSIFCSALAGGAVLALIARAMIPEANSRGRITHCPSNRRGLPLCTIPLISGSFYMIKGVPSDRQATRVANVLFIIRRFESPHTRLELSQGIPVVLSWNAPTNDRWNEEITRRRRLIEGVRLLRRKINRVIHAERENAIIYRLLANRFPSDSNMASSLRLLSRRATRRLRRLKGPLAELNEIWRPAPRTWGFQVRRWRALYTPHRWLCSREERKNKDRTSLRRGPHRLYQ